MRVLITGAGRGLGLALTQRYAQEGHIVHAATRAPRQSAGLQSLAQKYEQMHAHMMDVTSWQSVQACAYAVMQTSADLDLIINNAGFNDPNDFNTPVYALDVDVLRRTIAVNVEGPMIVLKAFYSFLKHDRCPKFYVITSESTMEHSWTGMPIYSLSKVAANKATGIIRVSMPHVQVLAIHPGRMRTDMNPNGEIEATEAAEGIYRLSTGELTPDGWYINYRGVRMPL